MEDVANISKASKHICCQSKSKNAYFSKTQSNSNVCFSKDELSFIVYLIIDNHHIFTTRRFSSKL